MHPRPQLPPGCTTVGAGQRLRAEQLRSGHHRNAGPCCWHRWMTPGPNWSRPGCSRADTQSPGSQLRHPAKAQRDHQGCWPGLLHPESGKAQRAAGPLVPPSCSAHPQALPQDPIWLCQSGLPSRSGVRSSLGLDAKPCRCVSVWALYECASWVCLCVCACVCVCCGVSVHIHVLCGCACTWVGVGVHHVGVHAPCGWVCMCLCALCVYLHVHVDCVYMCAGMMLAVSACTVCCVCACAHMRHMCMCVCIVCQYHQRWPSSGSRLLRTPLDFPQSPCSPCWERLSHRWEDS